ncbi:hypothetical protein LTS10_001217 [Elasticomyces elasticus]|nr:hypothetical protein LTS10_001217 [Elasticomyces elasticus]
MAANQVLDLPELFEAIVLQLPMRDLLFAQRVSKTWKANLDASPAVQKALFFTAGKKKDIIYVPANDITARKAWETYNATKIIPTPTETPEHVSGLDCLLYITRKNREGTAFNTAHDVDTPGPQASQQHPPSAAVVHFVIETKVWGPLKPHEITMEPGDRFEVLVEKYRTIIEEEGRVSGREGFEVFQDIVSLGGSILGFWRAK